MAVENSAWFDDFKNGNFFQRVHYFAVIIRMIIQALSLGLLVVGSLTLSAAYIFKHDFGHFLYNTLGDSSTKDVAENMSEWSKVWRVSTLNLDDCMTNVIQSVYSGFTVVLLSGLLCIPIGLWRSKALDYTCLLFLIAAMSCQGKEMKNFDNVLTPLHTSTMRKMRVAINTKAPFMDDDTLTALDFLMVKGNCCGIISGSDMDFFNFHHGENIQTKMESSELNILGPKPFVSDCWRENPENRNKMGCYVEYFETSIKPTVRCFYGCSILTQVIIFSLIVIQSEVPANKREALKILFYERLPVPFPVD